MKLTFNGFELECTAEDFSKLIADGTLEEIAKKYDKVSTSSEPALATETVKDEAIAAKDETDTAHASKITEDVIKRNLDELLRSLKPWKSAIDDELTRITWQHSANDPAKRWPVVMTILNDKRDNDSEYDGAAIVAETAPILNQMLRLINDIFGD